MGLSKVNECFIDVIEILLAKLSHLVRGSYSIFVIIELKYDLEIKIT